MSRTVPNVSSIRQDIEKISKANPGVDNILGVNNARIVKVTGGAGESNTASSAGGDVSLVLTKSAVDLPFRGITAGTNVTLASTASAVVINAAGAAGESNTASSAGGDVSLVLTKSAVDLPFRGISAGSNITLASTATAVEINASGGGSSVTRYIADSTSGEEIEVIATGTGITASRTGNVVSFVLPGGGVELLGARIRILGANLVSGAMVIDSGFGDTGYANMWPPVVQAWREDTQALLAITTTLSSSDYDQTTVNNLNATATNLVRVTFS